MQSINRTRSVVLASALCIFGVSTAFAQADNSNSKVAPASSFSGWMTDYSKTNNGRITRDAYMQESGRRW
ncbi:MAG: hypothetical protein ABIO63_00225, partial [Casimicrobiaceae bacterium]